MATSIIGTQQRAYGIGQGLQPIPPFTIVAQRAPTTSDRANIGTFWIYTTSNSCYVLVSINNGISNWVSFNQGGAGQFSSLQINGPSTFAGNITQTAGVTSLLATTTAGLTNNGVFNQNGNTVINAATVSGAFNVRENTADTVIYTESNANPIFGSRHLLCRQTSVAPNSVEFTTVKSRAGAVVNPGDLLFQQNFLAQGNTAEWVSAQIKVTAGTPLPGAEVPSSISFYTTNAAGAFAQKLDISSEGQLSIVTAGQTLAVTGGGATPFIGDDQLNAGTVAVACSAIALNDRVFITVVTPTNAGLLSVAVNAGVGFTVTSANAADNSTFNYFVVRQI